MSRLSNNRRGAVAAFLVVIVFASCRKESAPSTTTVDTAVSPAPTATIQPPELGHPPVEAPRISLEEARGWIEADRVRVLDVRSAEDYAAGHIPGALHIPVSRVAGEIAYLPRDKPILTYCT